MWHLLCNRRNADATALSLQLCTQIIEKNANPEWNQVLNLQVKVRGHNDGKMHSGEKVMDIMN